MKIIELIHKKIKLFLVIALALSLTFFYVSEKKIPKKIYSSSIHFLPAKRSQVVEIHDLINKLYINSRLFSTPYIPYSENNSETGLTLKLLKTAKELTQELTSQSTDNFRDYFLADKDNTRKQTENFLRKIHIEYLETNHGEEILLQISSSDENDNKNLNELGLYLQKKTLQVYLNELWNHNKIFINKLKTLRDFSNNQTHISSLNSELKRLNNLKDNIFSAQGQAFNIVSKLKTTSSIRDSLFLRVLASMVVGFVLSLFFIVFVNIKKLQN